VGAQLRLSVIIPVRDGGTDFQVCLEALAASSRPPDELLVVDDASADDSADTARQAGARLVARNETARGPAACRNMGAEAASGDVLVFVDADVRVHPQALAAIENHLVSSPDVAALFGSYDDDPPHRNVVSRYKNLLHHWVHQHSRREASTFWSGLGAIRRDVFDAVGGFDEAYALPSIEDIELGVRLTSSGHRVWLCPDVQGAHLKRWGLVSMLRADVFRRAVPWSRLIFSTSRLPSDLNLTPRSRVSAVSAWAATAMLLLAPWVPAAWTVGVAAAALVVGLNASLYAFFGKRGGLVFAAGAAVLHFLYLLYSSLVFGLVWVDHRLRNPGTRDEQMAAVNLAK
jgi:cellulose synthase/poly-beta-1,6-N-acetylglucosamine synthase-like glycosyltransferase